MHACTYNFLYIYVPAQKSPELDSDMSPQRCVCLLATSQGKLKVLNFLICMYVVFCGIHALQPNFLYIRAQY